MRCISLRQLVVTGCDRSSVECEMVCEVSLEVKAPPIEVELMKTKAAKTTAAVEMSVAHIESVREAEAVSVELKAAGVEVEAVFAMAAMMGSADARSLEEVEAAVAAVEAVEAELMAAGNEAAAKKVVQIQVA